MKKYRHWTYVVLTYPRGDYPNVQQLYRAGKQHWDLLRKRVLRRWGPFKYIQTWEKHQSGYPHANLVIANEEFHRVASGSRLVSRAWWEGNAVACGFGKRTWVDPIVGSDGMAGYLAKVSRELTGSNVKDQTPTNAPPHYRRLRASTRLLPPPIKNPDVSGMMKFRPEGDETAKVEYWKEEGVYYNHDGLILWEAKDGDD